YGNNYELNGVYISFNNKTEFLIPFIITFKFIYFENDIAKSYITDSKDKYFKNYEYLTYNNSKIRAPFDYKNYLYDLYGDWKIVKKDFSFSDILTFKENSLKKSYRIYFDINSIISFSINIKKVLFLYDIYFEKSAYYNHILNFLKHKKIFSFGIDYSNPDFEDIFELLNKIKNNKFDSIIALGGGSVLDTLKAVCCFHGLNIEKIDDLRQCIITKNYLNNESKYLKIAIPTTAGTGSEVTPWATIWDKEKNQKYSIEKNELIPQKVFLISDITTSMPLKITVSTALDALSHALEAYWSKRTTDKVRENSLKSINLIVENLPSLIDDLTNIKLRERMLKASFYAGLAFSKTKTTSCHSISYPLTMKYNIPHGVAVSMTLAELLEINYSALVNPDDLFQAFGCDSVIEIKKWINLIYNKAGIKYKLRDYGVKKEELENLADLCFTPGRMDNNPVSLSKENVLFVLKNIL
ncbi:MAG: iron-containing alcohol dehydrogenase, partial [Candidatus Muiribacteriota bacterium]